MRPSPVHDADQFAEDIELISTSTYDENKKKSCTCCNWQNKKLWYFILIILVIIFIFGIIQKVIIAAVIETKTEEQIRNQVVMKEEYSDGSNEAYNKWIDNSCDDCVQGLFYYYLYNMTNSEDVLYASAIPQFEELGPWVYKRYEKKENIRFYDSKVNNSRLVDYIIDYDYVFQSELSTDLDRYTTKVYTINFALLGFFNTINYLQGWTALSSILEKWDELLRNAPIESILYNETVNKYLHGINNDMIESISPFPNVTFFRLVPSGSIAVTEKTGLYDINNCRELLFYRNLSKPENLHPLLGNFIKDIWNTSVSVSGSRETRQFPPFNYIGKHIEYDSDNIAIDGDGVLNIWSTEKFRNVNYVFDSEIIYEGLKMYRYRITDEIYLNITDRYQNKAYHLNNLPSGLLNLTLVKGSPSFQSKGHFLGYDYYQENVNNKFKIKMIDNGPNIEEDDQYFDMHPGTGIGLRQFHSFQFNFHVIKLNREYNTSYKDAELSFWEDILPFARVKIRGSASDEQFQQIVAAYKQIDDYNMASLVLAGVISFVCFIMIIGVIVKLIRMKKNDKSSVTSVNKKVSVEMISAQTTPFNANDQDIDQSSSITGTGTSTKEEKRDLP